jgi:hypothetical protein
MLTQESGSTGTERCLEAQRIMAMGLPACTSAMREREAVFVTDMAAKLKRYEDACCISPSQLFWLRDLKDTYL